MTDRTCTIDGCERARHSRGWCLPHYKRWRKHGDPTGGRDRHSAPGERFAALTQWREGCLVWTGRTTTNGYGSFSLGGRRVRSHRYAWERVNGPIPDGLVIDHVCHNPLCVNVDHLRLATHSENLQNRQGARHGSSTGVRNVYPVGGAKPSFKVMVRHGGKLHYFGSYSTAKEAAAVAERERARLFGVFAGGG